MTIHKIAVIGGGLGGLSAALAFHRTGFNVDVYEQAPELNEVGGGINMGPNAARILYRLGLGEALDGAAVRPASAHVRRWDDGRTLQTAPLNPRCDELYGAPHLTAIDAVNRHPTGRHVNPGNLFEDFPGAPRGLLLEL